MPFTTSMGPVSPTSKRHSSNRLLSVVGCLSEFAVRERSQQ